MTSDEYRELLKIVRRLENQNQALVHHQIQCYRLIKALLSPISPEHQSIIDGQIKSLETLKTRPSSR